MDDTDLAAILNLSEVLDPDAIEAIVNTVLNAVQPRPKSSSLGSYFVLKKNHELVGERCIICFEDYEPRTHIRELPACKHIFHRKCLTKWFNKSKKMECPLCRKTYD